VTIDWFSAREALALDKLTDGAREVIAAITPAAAPSP
jgi:hypothetical protein